MSLGASSSELSSVMAVARSSSQDRVAAASLRLQLLHVDRVGVQRPAALAAHDHVQPGEGGLADHRAVVEGGCRRAP